MNPSLPLFRLLGHTADAVQAVRGGVSLTESLAACAPDARPGTQALSFLVLRRLGTATALRARLVPKTPPPALDALLLSALALLWRDAALPAALDGDPPYPEHTVVDQAVKAAQARQLPGGFVNAVLRRFLRERMALADLLRPDEVALHNHPAWWIARLRQDWPGDWAAILAANNARAPMTLRVNLRRGNVADYLTRLANAGLAAQPGPLPGGTGRPASAAVWLDRPVPVGRLPGFESGEVSVQDAGAQVAAALLLAEGPGLPALPPRLRVLDACAAPGGKTAQLLEQCPPGTEIDLLALDQDPHRLRRVGETLARLGLGARVVAADAGEPATWWDGVPFDAILLDAPCSASGIVRRHPDVRWLRRPGDIDRLAATQARLLDALWPTLAPGGRLAFCTCSVFKAEGVDQIDAFLQRQRDASWVDTAGSPGHLLPLVDNPRQGPTAVGGPSDGFFHALLVKR